MSCTNQVLESSENSELIELCLEGVKKAVRIAGGLDVPVRECVLLELFSLESGKASLVIFFFALMMYLKYTFVLAGARRSVSSRHPIIRVMITSHHITIRHVYKYMQMCIDRDRPRKRELCYVPSLVELLLSIISGADKTTKHLLPPFGAPFTSQRRVVSRAPLPCRTATPGSTEHVLLSVCVLYLKKNTMPQATPPTHISLNSLHIVPFRKTPAPGCPRDSAERAGAVHPPRRLSPHGAQERALRQGAAVPGADGREPAQGELGAGAAVHLPARQVGPIDHTSIHPSIGHPSGKAIHRSNWQAT